MHTIENKKRVPTYAATPAPPVKARTLKRRRPLISNALEYVGRHAIVPAPSFIGDHDPESVATQPSLNLYQGAEDTLFRIHRINQPKYISQAILSGCIRMTNEDVIDLYGKVKMGAVVVVLAPGEGRPLPEDTVLSVASAAGI